MQEEQIYYLKILLAGNAKVGKQTFVDAFRNPDHANPFYVNPYHRKYKPKTFSNYTFRSSYKGNTVHVDLWPMDGDVTQPKVNELSYPDTDVVFFCYALDDKHSITAVEDIWISRIQNFFKNERMPCFIFLGMKSDLVSADNDSDEIRAKAIGLKRKFKAVYEHTCSSFQDKGIKDIVNKAIAAGVEAKYGNENRYFCNIL
eukprot:maker-scaffold_48-snap-gene-0.39-mRNA-1 protein AED:0.35 eAED:0.35 QI:72/1/1/1/0.4/0.33/6/101/200